MSAVRLTFDVPSPDVLYAAGWTQIKVKRSIDAGVTWTEVSRSTTRIPLRDVVERYHYSDSSGAVTYLYQAVYYNPTTLADNPVPLSITDIQLDGYATVAEIRAEGVTVTDASDARVTVAIDWATRYIDRATKRQFGPRFAIQRFDVPLDSDTLLLPEPLIALLRMVTVDAEDVDLASLEVYNRHLRGGEMCDLSAPQLKISDDLDTDTYFRLWYGTCTFERGSQAATIYGIWGYTEPSRGAVGGETSDGSQVPIDYGVVPPLINWACRALVLQHLFPMFTAEDFAAGARRVTSLRTRDQSVTFSATDAEIASGWDCSSAVHEVLAGYGKAFAFGSP